MLENNTNIDNQQASNLSDKVVEASTASRVTSLVECQICHKFMKDLNSHLNRCHHITCKHYQELYDNAPIMSENMRATRKKLYTDTVLKSKTTESCSKGGKKSAEIKILNGTMEDFMKNMRNYELTEQQKAERSHKISESHKNNFKTSPEQYRRRMKRAQEIMHEKIRNMSPEDLKLYLQNSFLGSYKLKELNYKGIKLKLRSSYERRLAIYLIDNNVPFQYEAISIKYNKHHKYYPDFLIDNTILEVKSMYFLNKDWEKNVMKEEAAKKQGYEFYFITEAELNNKELLDSIIGKIHKCTTSQ